MAFGKTPLTDQQKATFRAQAEAELARRALLGPVERVSALQPYIAEELADLKLAFGEDERLDALAVSFAIQRVLHSPRDGEAVIEADIALEKLDAAEGFSAQEFESWATAVTSPPPKNYPRRRAFVPSEHALTCALEMYWAFLLTNGREARPARDPFADPVAQHLLSALAPVLKEKIEGGSQFVRDPSTIVLDWVSRRRRLRKQYRPTGDLRAPRAFLAAEFRFGLDREKRRVGLHEVRPGFLRAIRRKLGLEKGAVVSSELVDSFRDQSHANMTHAPPASMMTSATLRDHLVDRQAGGLLAWSLARAGNADERRAIVEQLVDLDLYAEVEEWLDEPAASRGARPAWSVGANVATGKRSVDALVIAYEHKRGEPFVKHGKSRHIPIGELRAIIDFANHTAETLRR